MALRGKLARVAVLAITVLVIVAGAAAIPWLAEPTEAPSQPDAYDVAELNPERPDSSGRIQAETRIQGGTVLIDDAHLNRYEKNEIQPLVSAITQAGYEVEFVDSGDDFEEELEQAKTLLVIDPGEAYDEDEVDAVEEFVDEGGHLLMMGEPTRSEISLSRFGATLETVQNRLTPLATRFGISFGEGYLYNMERNDGNFQNVFARSTDADVVEGIDRTTMHTAAYVEVREGTRLLVTANGTRTARGDRPGTYAVAVQTSDENVIAVGDVTFIQRGNYNVLDNERFIGALVDFMTASTREPEPEETATPIGNESEG